MTTMSLPTYVRPGLSPAERARYVADLIESTPERFAMNVFVGDRQVPPFFQANGSRFCAGYAEGWRPDLTPECGTTFCVAGWTVASATPEEVAEARQITGAATRDFDVVASYLLAGFDQSVFYDMKLTPTEAADKLRAWAGVLEGKA